MAQAGPQDEEKKQKVDQIELKNKNGTATVQIHPFGATVTSWKVDGEEQLFLSTKAKLDQTKAIRGGIPLVFPQFGPGPMKQHGFARVCAWNLDKRDSDAVVLSLSDSDLSDEWKKEFPFAFKLEYTVRVTETNYLCTELRIANNEKQNSFEYTTLFHTYFRVNAKAIQVSGLQGLMFNDKLDQRKAPQLKNEGNEHVGIDGEVDRIYCDIGDKDIVLMDKTKEKYQVITIKRTNFADVVLWNPWIDKSKRMSDFDDEEYKEMVCVEPGSVTRPVTLKPGESKVYSQTLIASQNTHKL